MALNKKGAVNLLLILGLLAAFGAGYLAINEFQFKQTALAYGFLFGLVVAAYLIIPKLPQITSIAMLSTGLFQGLILGVGFIALNTINKNFSIGFPLSTGGLAVTTLIAAPIIETLAFAVVLPLALMLLFRNMLISMVISSAAFALFHFAYYGATLAQVTSPFIGAFLFNIAAIGVWWYWSRNPTSAMIGHAIFNYYLARKYFIAIGVPA